ncbi:MAG: hypothetical protein R3B36_30095 [Polyangiaceae bacterium]
MSPRLTLSFGALLALATTSCFALTDLDRFQTRAGRTGNFVDLRLTVRGMKSHVNELFEYRIVDGTNTIQSRGFITPLGGVDATVFVPGAIPKLNGPFRLDFYADHDSSGGYDKTPATQGDHAWRLPLDETKTNAEGVVDIVFDHNTSFSYLNDPAEPKEVGQPFVMKFTNMGGLIGRRIQVRVADASSGRVVALFRNPAITQPAFDGTVAGMIEPSVGYAVEVYSDDGQAGAGSVREWRIEKDSVATGLTVDFDPATFPSASNLAPP